tara:strand:- start:614 stop:856 length:243 start_codon:yes stop_codon:yes gene_type:complete
MDNIINVTPESATIGIIWVCLNSVDFTGNHEAEEEHRRLLLLYRRKLAKIEGVEPKQIRSEMLEVYDAVNKARSATMAST